jgi:hypothetical protein
MTRPGSFALVSAVAVVLLPAAVTSGARQVTADGSVRLTVGAMRLLSPRFGYAVAYRTVQRGTTAQTTIGLFVYDEGRWRNVTPPALEAEGIDAIAVSAGSGSDPVTAGSGSRWIWICCTRASN